MKLVDPEQMREIDKRAITEYGIPGIVLMENAANAITAEATAMLDGSVDADILLLAGTGNNGGDAFAAARKLDGRGFNTKVYILGAKASVMGDARINLDILEKVGVKVNELTGDELPGEFIADLNNARLIIDGIFGTGLSRDIDGLTRSVIEIVNSSGKPVISIDIPSGVDGRDGSIKGVCVKASVTVTFCLPKTGLVLHPGCECVGRLVVADISIPQRIIHNMDIRTEYTDFEMVSRIIPQRRQNSNKGDYGRVLLVTGSTGMTGSGCLASMAALRSGAGLVYTAVPERLASIYSSVLTEPIILPLENDENGCLAPECAKRILSHMERMSVAAIGPGLTASKNISGIMEKILPESKIPLVLDADALNAIAGNVDALRGLKVPAVITPHPGEMSRLTGLEIREIQSDRIGVARKFAADYNVTVVLKGSKTVVALPDGRTFVNSTGNAGMATAGTGDVLTGIIAGLIAQGVETGEAAAAGVFLHGLAGDMAAERLGMHGMLAGDVIGMLPEAIMKLQVRGRASAFPA